MKVEARGLAAELDEIAMDAKDIAAHADERHLGFGYPMDGCVAFCRRDTRDGAARGHDLSDQRRHGDDGAIHSRFGFGDRQLQALGGKGELIRHSFSFPGRMNSRFFASTTGRDQPEISRVSEWPIARSDEHTSELQNISRHSYT